jgi:GGDEF domain-containing protein
VDEVLPRGGVLRSLPWIRDRRLPLRTCSFGVAALGEQIGTVPELYEAADRALYRSKNAGRNTVTAWE